MSISYREQFKWCRDNGRIEIDGEEAWVKCKRFNTQCKSSVCRAYRKKRGIILDE